MMMLLKRHTPGVESKGWIAGVYAIGSYELRVCMTHRHTQMAKGLGLVVVWICKLGPGSFKLALSFSSALIACCQETSHTHSHWETLTESWKSDRGDWAAPADRRELIGCTPRRWTATWRWRWWFACVQGWAREVIERKRIGVTLHWTRGGWVSVGMCVKASKERSRNIGGSLSYKCMWKQIFNRKIGSKNWTNISKKCKKNLSKR